MYDEHVHMKKKKKWSSSYWSCGCYSLLLPACCPALPSPLLAAGTASGGIGGGVVGARASAGRVVIWLVTNGLGGIEKGLGWVGRGCKRSAGVEKGSKMG